MAFFMRVMMWLVVLVMPGGMLLAPVLLAVSARRRTRSAHDGSVVQTPLAA